MGAGVREGVTVDGTTVTPDDGCMVMVEFVVGVASRLATLPTTVGGAAPATVVSEIERAMAGD
jgi:hypothetical protein